MHSYEDSTTKVIRTASLAGGQRLLRIGGKKGAFKVTWLVPLKLGGADPSHFWHSDLKITKFQVRLKPCCFKKGNPMSSLVSYSR